MFPIRYERVSDDAHFQRVFKRLGDEHYVYEGKTYRLVSSDDNVRLLDEQYLCAVTHRGCSGYATVRLCRMFDHDPGDEDLSGRDYLEF